MATITPTPIDGRKKITCDAPRCLTARSDRKQARGRYLGTVQIGQSEIVLEYICAECGTAHSLTFSLEKAGQASRLVALTPKTKQEVQP